MGGPVTAEELLFLAWPPNPRDIAVALAVVLYIDLAWESRSEAGFLLPISLSARVNDVAEAVPGAAVSSIFR